MASVTLLVRQGKNVNARHTPFIQERRSASDISFLGSLVQSARQGRRSYIIGYKIHIRQSIDVPAITSLRDGNSHSAPCGTLYQGDRLLQARKILKDRSLGVIYGCDELRGIRMERLGRNGRDDGLFNTCLCSS